MIERKKRLIFNEAWPLLNILNEITHGIYINNFDEVIGAKKEFVEALLDRFLMDERDGLKEVFLNNEEVEIFKKALHAVENTLEEWEFQTRIGVTHEESKKILHEIDR